MAKKKSPLFEESLATLELLVKKMDSGELELEQSLEAFEQGIKLIRECQQTLQAAEQKVQMLVEGSDALSMEAFDAKL